MEIKRQQHALLKKNMAIKHIKIEQKRQRIRDLSKYYRNLAMEINMKKATGKLYYTILYYTCIHIHILYIKHVSSLYTSTCKYYIL